MTDEKSIFTRIIEGEIPCFKVFENDYVYSFLDINPVSRGHVLVIPKEPARFLHELSPKSSSELELWHLGALQGRQFLCLCSC